ncbi:MAG: single-stranded DNA-binding protein [Microbacteriaceae bacterium]
MSETITVVGFIATDPRHLVTGEALPITSFRLASTSRRFDRGSSSWVDGETNWFTVNAFRQLALNANASLRKGDRVVVSGRLRVRGWAAGDKSGTAVEIDADAIGHDLVWGTTAFTRTLIASRSGGPVEPEAADVLEAADAPESAPDAPESASPATESAPEPLAVPF